MVKNALTSCWELQQEKFIAVGFKVHIFTCIIKKICVNTKPEIILLALNASAS